MNHLEITKHGRQSKTDPGEFTETFHPYVGFFDKAIHKAALEGSNTGRIQEHGRLCEAYIIYNIR